MQETTGRRIVDDHRILNALLRSLTSKRTLSEGDMDTIMDVTIQRVVSAIHAEAITVFLVGKDDKIHFQNVYYAPGLYAGDEVKKAAFLKQSEKLQDVTLEKGQGIVGRVISGGEPYLSPDVTKDPNFFGGVQKDTGFRVRSMITVPLIVEEPIGAIQALNKRVNDKEEPFTEKDVVVLQEVASYSARVIQKARHPGTEFSDAEMAQWVARQTRLEYMPLGENFEPNSELLNIIGEDVLREFKILPLEKTGSQALKVAMSDPLDIQRKDSFQLKTRMAIEHVVVSGASEILGVLDNFFKANLSSNMGDMSGLLDQYAQTEEVHVEDNAAEDSAPIIQLANRIIEDAYARQSSDIHIEPFEKDVRVRYRIDGVLEEVLRLPVQACKALVARLKIMSELDISENRIPQDGRIAFKQFTRTGIDIDLRVATGPMQHGEKVVMRILDKQKSTLPLEQLGFSKSNMDLYRSLIVQPFGMILHCGPTGSGKSMTLYAALNEINTPEVNIQTAEDPIEYTLYGINQMQMRKKIGLTFAAALRCYLRQDPDIILVGEIRDTETAEIAIEAALTGHLLFSTLHTNDAAGTVTRFTDMGIEPFLICSSLLMICAQRLMRRLCKNCKEPYVPEGREAQLLELDKYTDSTCFKPKGCNQCHGTGFRGRTGTHEILTMSDPIRELTLQRAAAERIKEAAMKDGMITLHKDSMEKVRLGITGFEEAVGEVRVDEGL